MDFLKILGAVFLVFIGFFAGVAAIMFMVAGPTLAHALIGTPIALVVISSCIYGLKKIIDSHY